MLCTLPSVSSFDAMGQPITVIRKPTTQKGTVRFEANRSLTGMGHERYTTVDEAAGNRPPDEVARRFFQHPGVQAVHVYGNQIVVEVAGGADVDALAPELERLFIHYREGVTPSYPPPGQEEEQPAEAGAPEEAPATQL